MRNYLQDKQLLLLSNYTKQPRKEKKGRKKSRKSVESTAVPGLRRKPSRMDSRRSVSMSTGASGPKHLEMVILSAFHSSDPDGTGFVQQEVFWEVRIHAKFSAKLLNSMM